MKAELQRGGGGSGRKASSGARVDTHTKPEEREQIRQWRITELTKAGMIEADAVRFASEPWALDLIRRGCPVELVEKILND